MDELDIWLKSLDINDETYVSCYNAGSKMIKHGINLMEVKQIIYNISSNIILEKEI